MSTNPTRLAPADPAGASGIGPDVATPSPVATPAPSDGAGAGRPRPRPRSKARRRWRVSPEMILLVVGATVFTLLILLPVVAIFVRVLPQDQFWAIARRPVVVEALRLSMMTTGLTLAFAIGLGTPLAFLLARYRFPGKTLLDSLIELPMVLPPAVAGLGLLMAFGRRGLFGPFLESIGITVG